MISPQQQDINRIKEYSNEFLRGIRMAIKDLHLTPENTKKQRDWLKEYIDNRERAPIIADINISDILQSIDLLLKKYNSELIEASGTIIGADEENLSEKKPLDVDDVFIKPINEEEMQAHIDAFGEEGMPEDVINHLQEEQQQKELPPKVEPIATPPTPKPMFQCDSLNVVINPIIDVSMARVVKARHETVSADLYIYENRVNSLDATIDKDTLEPYTMRQALSKILKVDEAKVQLLNQDQLVMGCQKFIASKFDHPEGIYGAIMLHTAKDKLQELFKIINTLNDKNSGAARVNARRTLCALLGMTKESSKLNTSEELEECIKTNRTAWTHLVGDPNRNIPAGNYEQLLEYIKTLNKKKHMDFIEPISLLVGASSPNVRKTMARSIDPNTFMMACGNNINATPGEIFQGLPDVRQMTSQDHEHVGKLILQRADVQSFIKVYYYGAKEAAKKGSLSYMQSLTKFTERATNTVLTIEELPSMLDQVLIEVKPTIKVGSPSAPISKGMMGKQDKKQDTLGDSYRSTLCKYMEAALHKETRLSSAQMSQAGHILLRDLLNEQIPTTKSPKHVKHFRDLDPLLVRQSMQLFSIFGANKVKFKPSILASDKTIATNDIEANLDGI